MMKQVAKLSLVGAVLASTLAFANDEKFNLVSFEVASQTSVENNEATATMSKSVSAKNAKELANKINPIINQALAIAKKYPAVKVSTGSQYAHPEYSKGKIVGVSGSASLNLKSQDTEQMSNLMSELQIILLLESLSFDVSDALRETTQAKLRDEATQKFRNEAASLAKSWGAKSYRLVNAQMNGSSSGGYAKRYGSPMMAEMVMQAAPASAQELQVGTSEIRYHINGTIQLLY